MPDRILALLLAIISVLTLACGRPLTDPVTSPRLYEITPDVERDSSAEIQRMAATIAPYSARLETVMNRILAEVAVPLTKAQPESSLGNWTADLTLAAARDLFPEVDIAFAVQNYGGLRVNEIGTGPLLVSEMYELMPFDNELVVVEVTGAELEEFVAHTLSDGGWPVSEGLSAVRNGGMVTVRVNGQPVDPGAIYHIAMPDYVANGGSDSAMLVGKRQMASGRLVRDLLIEYAGRHQTPIHVVPDGSRIKIEQP
ncbi:5'-nucleotidase C-terminal domain-containing protein [Neolewinella litorea]|uniref:5'-Nucleotidase C-terminal domain-containing protein n=1 Tax=Neolewinella litorea TaxID=2562452 RepID=A0A4S4NST3_9BACT|nr:5'-nucleotidase C-terminal domain-containing protein [Neolewinella litorea]THH41508.1 hypothetical protein E4021_02625 [Neolewinella litorea]